MQRTWLGGGNDSASNPNDWSPTRAPQPGDTLTATNAAPIHVTGNALAGDPVSIAGGGPGSFNPETATFDLANGANINLAVFGDNAALNISGTATVTGHIGYGTLNTGGGTLQFIKGGTLALGAEVSSTINSNLTGTGTLAMSGGEGAGVAATLGGSVGSGVTINLAASQPVLTLDIAHPSEFKGLLDFTQNGSAGFGSVLLEDMKATSGFLIGNSLDLFNGSRLVDTMRVGGYTSGLTLQQTSSGTMIGQNEHLAGTALPLYHIG